MATKTSSCSSSLSLFSSPLTIDQLIDVLDLLKRCGFPQTRWHELGLRLGLHKNTLDALEMIFRGDISRCLLECLSQWLSRADNFDSKGRATFDSLSDALKSMNENAAANKLDQEKRKAKAIDIFNTHHPLLSQSLSDPVSVARLLQREGVITGQVLASVESASPSVPNQREVLLAAIIVAIESKYSLLQTFASVLRKFTGNVKLGTVIQRDYDKYFNDVISNDDMDNGTFHTGAITPIPYTPTVEIAVPQSMSHKFTSIQMSYGRMLYKVRKIMKNKPPPLDDVIEYLCCCRSSLEPKLSLCSNITEILRVVEKECSLINVSLLQSLVKEFEINEAEKYITEYKGILKEFCRTVKITLCWNEKFVALGSNCSLSATYVFDWEPDEHMLQDFKLIISETSGKLAKIKYIKKGSEVFQPAPGPEIIEKWLKEGSVELTVTRVNMHGPPGAGKTCAQDLLLNNSPTTHTTDSTPIARPAVKATRVSVDNEAMKWEKVNRDGLLERLASDLKEAAASQPKEKIFASQYEEIIKKNSYPVSTDNQQTTEPHDKSTVKRVDSATETDESSLASQESFSIGEGVIQEIVGTIQSSEDRLNISGHWLYIIDSGGQPAYQELLPLFVRTASLNIITLNLSQPLDKKLDFKYRIGGETFSCGLNFKYSNRDFFLSAVSSGAILKPIDVPHVLETPSHPMNFVLGTHYDLITEDKLKDMNKELMSSLKPDVENYVVPNVRGESIIFPVNTLVPEDKGRMKAGQDLCQSIANCGGTSLKINVPIRWFAFELWLQKVAEDKSRSFLIIDEVISAGAKLKMSEDDTKDALQYLHNVTIILYYPDILPQLVFVDPKPILEVLSRLLALTYVERKALHLIANPVPSEKDISKLHNVGFFKEKLLKDHFKSLFSPPHFEPSHLLKLLIHLHIIASGEDGDYFIPCALESYTEPPELQTETKPLLIVWQDKNTVPVPQGMFPLLIIHLLCHKDDYCTVDFPQSTFSPLDPQYYRYRDALSLWIKIKIRVRKRYTLHIINHYTHIEVYFVGSVQKAKQICPYIHKLFMKAVSDSAKAINIEHNHVTAFSCPKRSTCYCVVDVEEEDFETNCTSCADSADISGDSYWCWFGIVDCDSKMIMSDSGHSQPLDVCDLDDILTDLKDGHYYSSNWKELGLKLGLYDNTLSTIESNYSDVEDRLRKCIVKWLQRADGVDVKGGATWTTLVKALEQCDSGKPTADHIRHKRLKRNADQLQTDDDELSPTTIKKNKPS